jgi:hypothetical protein
METQKPKVLGKIPFIVSCVFSFFALVALILYVIFFVTVLEGIANAAQGADLASGLQAVFGFIFCLLFVGTGGTTVFSSAFALGFSLYAFFRAQGSLKTASLVMWIANAVVLLFIIISFICLMVKL